MKIGILSSNNENNDVESLSKSKLASNRLRLNIFKDAALDKSENIVLPLDFYEKGNKADLIIIGKIVEKSGANIYLDDEGQRINKWIRYIQNAKKENTKIILDYTDNLIEVSDNRSDFYRHIISQVDIAVVPSQQMRENLQKFFNKKILIIEEPLEENVVAFKDDNLDKIKALWFGHLSNINYLLLRLNKLDVDELTIVTSNLSQINKQNIIKINNKIKYKFINWEPNYYKKNDLNCNICLIPSDVNDRRKNGVSNNRLITSIALGLIPIASVVESYQEYSNYFMDIDSINDNKININRLNELKNILKIKQMDIIEKYSVENIKLKWQKNILNDLN